MGRVVFKLRSQRGIHWTEDKACGRESKRTIHRLLGGRISWQLMSRSRAVLAL